MSTNEDAFTGSARGAAMPATVGPYAGQSPATPPAPPAQDGPRVDVVGDAQAAAPRAEVTNLSGRRVEVAVDTPQARAEANSRLNDLLHRNPNITVKIHPRAGTTPTRVVIRGKTRVDVADASEVRNIAAAAAEPFEGARGRGIAVEITGRPAPMRIDPVSGESVVATDAKSIQFYEVTAEARATA